MPSRLLIGSLLGVCLLSIAAFGQGMSVGGGAFGSADPFASDPFAAATDDFGADDPADDGFEFTGRDALAVLRAATMEGEGLPDGLQVASVDEVEPSPFDRAQDGVGEVRLHLDGANATVVWRAYADPGSAVGAVSRLLQDVAQRTHSTNVEQSHVFVGENDVTCAMAQLGRDHLSVTCALSIGLDPLQSLGIVEGNTGKDVTRQKLVELAAKLAAWGRDRWIRIEGERHSG
jgi:hypothetical protein